MRQNYCFLLRIRSKLHSLTFNLCKAGYLTEIFLFLGKRGGVIGAIASMGVIVGSDVPMFIGAMIVGPLAAWIIKKFDKAVEGHIPAGFEMLVNN